MLIVWLSVSVWIYLRFCFVFMVVMVFIFYGIEVGRGVKFVFLLL